MIKTVYNQQMIVTGGLRCQMWEDTVYSQCKAMAEKALLNTSKDGIVSVALTCQSHVAKAVFLGSDVVPFYGETVE